MEAIVALSDVVGIPLAAVDCAGLDLEAVAVLVHLPHGKGDVDQIVDVGQSLGCLERPEAIRPAGRGGGDGREEQGSRCQLHSGTCSLSEEVHKNYVLKCSQCAFFLSKIRYNLQGCEAGRGLECAWRRIFFSLKDIPLSRKGAFSGGMHSLQFYS